MKRRLTSRFLMPWIFTMLLFFIGSGSVQAQASNNNSELIIYVITAFSLMMAVLVLLVCIYVLFTLKLYLTPGLKTTEKKESLFSNLWQKINRRFVSGELLPVEREKEIMMDHSYDGISELDNHMPPWLKYLFYGTIGFAVVYMAIYLVFDTGKSQIEEYQEELAYAEEIALARKEPGEMNIDENTVTMTTDPAAIETAKTLYLQNCAACHGQQGEGTVGPNLTDAYWLHGGSVQDIFKVIKYGVPEKGMIPWQDMLDPEQIQNVASFILTLQGTTPPNPKAPQGEKHIEEKMSDGSMSSL